MRKCKNRSAAFTLIELMVVVALVGVLMAGVFKLMGAAAESSKRSQTIARLQRLENAIAGFHAEYGTYPPVPLHESPDPLLEWSDSSKSYSAGSFSGANCNRAAASQPVSFEFPCKRVQDPNLHAYFAAAGMNVISANEVINSFDQNRTEWQNVKLFKFGLLSFLLPRLSTIGQFDNRGNLQGRYAPDEAAFDKQQWKIYNSARRGSYAEQLDRESIACARWLPNLQGLIHGGPNVLGVNTGDNFLYYSAHSHNGQQIGLRRVTVLDGWDRDIYYYSAPPYQSYRLWSAGTDGMTFPPDYPLDKLTSAQRAQVAKWIKDDIVGFDR